MLFNTGHAATAAIAVIGTVVALRGPWTTSAAAPTPQPVVYVDQYGQALQAQPLDAASAARVTAPASFAAAPRPVTRVVMQPVAAPAVMQPMTAPPSQTVAAPVRYSPRPAPVVERAPNATVVTAEKPARSWKKRALVIGGSAGAGAGVGAIVAGKKGAGIGAAIGGGTAAIWEAFKK